jgi:NADH:flavin oxidoreductase / NADH oxidase family
MRKIGCLPPDSNHRGRPMGPMSRLFEPITLGGVTLANRIAVSPMCQYSAENGSANGIANRFHD